MIPHPFAARRHLARGASRAKRFILTNLGGGKLSAIGYAILCCGCMSLSASGITVSSTQTDNYTFNLQATSPVNSSAWAAGEHPYPILHDSLFQFPQFNPALGTLTGAHVSYSLHDVADLYAGAGTASAKGGGNMAIPAYYTVPGYVGQQINPPIDPNFTVNTTSGPYVSYLATSVQTSNQQFDYAGASLNQFIGTGSVSTEMIERAYLAANTNPAGHPGFNGSIAFQINGAPSSASFTVAYDYTPATITYTAPDLNHLPGTQTWATAGSINNSGAAVGSSNPGTGEQAVLWTPNVPNGATGTMQQLGSLLANSQNSRATAINDNGYIAGDSGLGAPGVTSHSFLWNPNTQSMIDIGQLPGAPGTGVGGMNNSQTIVGTTGFNVYGVPEAFMWTPGGGIQALANYDPGWVTGAYAINDNGLIVGGAYHAGAVHAVMWTDPNTIVDLGSLAGPTGSSLANAVNAAGDIVGKTQVDGGVEHAMLYTAGTMLDLGALNGPGGTSYAYGINAAGWIVGDSTTDAGTHAFLWTPAYGMQDLNAYFHNAIPGWTLVSARGINDAGQVVGYALDGDGNTRAFELAVSPVPEPASVVLVVVGLLAAVPLARARRAHQG